MTGHKTNEHKITHPKTARSSIKNKNYALIGWLWLLAVVAWFAGWWFQHNRTVGASLLSEVPGVYDQVLYAVPDDEMYEWLQKVWNITSLSGTKELLATTNELVVWQYAPQGGGEEDAFVLLFLDVRDDFSFEKAKEMWILATGEDVAYERLGGSRYVYGDKLSLEYLHDYTSGSALEDEVGEDFIDAFVENHAHIGFLSQPWGLLQGQTNPFVQQFADKLQWTYARSRLGKDTQQAKIIFRFKEQMLKEPKTAFVPVLWKNVPEDVALYVELHDLLGLFGINETQVTWLLPLLAQQAGGDYAGVLGPNDRQSLANIAKWALSITVAPTGTVPGMGIRVIVADKWLYTIFQKIAPFVRTLLEAYSGTWSVRMEQGQQVSRWMVTLGGTWGMSFPVLTVTQTGEGTQIDILGTQQPSQQKSNVQLTYTPTSYMSFVLNSAMLQQSLWALSPAWLMWWVAGQQQQDIVWTVIYGDIHTENEGKELVISLQAKGQ